MRRFPAVRARHLLAPALLVGGAAAPCVPLAAQALQQLTLDAGGATLAQANVPRVTAPTMAASWRVANGSAALDLTGAATLASADRWAAQGVVAGAWSPGRSGDWELGGVATGLRYRGGSPAAHALGLVRRRLDGDGWGGWGAWVGGGGGFLSRERLHAPIVAADGGLWWRGRGPTFSLALSAQRARLDSIGGPGAVPAPLGLAPTAPPTLSNTAGGAVGNGVAVLGVVRPVLAVDLTGGFSWVGRRGELAASAGLRRAPVQFTGARAVLLASGVFWAHPRVGVVASAGDQVADPLRGMPAVRHLSLGLRWRLVPPAVATVRPSAPASSPTPATIAAPTAEFVEDRGQPARLRVLAPGAARVEVRGDWTEWRSMPMTVAGDAWELTAPLPSGTRRLMIRVDGGAWRVPANLAGADDEFGSRVGLLVVP